MSNITRRNFVNGTLMTAGASLLPFGGANQAVMAALAPSYYPPTLTGLRGSQPGSNDHAHARAWDGKSDWGLNTKLNEEYDLVVVGGGISGLSAAYFYQQTHGKDKKVLILDNHDDFGGHARRNEHTIDGNIILGEGGSESIQAPYSSGKVVLDLFKDIGIDIELFKKLTKKTFQKQNFCYLCYFFRQKTLLYFCRNKK